jgi:nucleoside-diphosphate kinase
MERTLIVIKPDGVQRSLMGDVISRFEKVGVKFVGFKFFIPTEDLCWKHYDKDDAWFTEKGGNILKMREEAGLPIEKKAAEYGKDIVRQLATFMTCGPVLAMVLEGNQAVGIVKKVVGGTEPLTSDVGTIRGDYTLDSYDKASLDGRAVRNIIHCSDKVEEAEREIKLWFKDDELVNYKLVSEKILYDVNLDGIKE